MTDGTATNEQIIGTGARTDDTKIVGDMGAAPDLSKERPVGWQRPKEGEVGFDSECGKQPVGDFTARARIVGDMTTGPTIVGPGNATGEMVP